MKASGLFVECLEREGVERVYGLPGEETEDLLFSLRDSDVSFVPTRHEQGAAFMADVHGRVTGEAGVCLSTLGPGATNLLTGVADAHLDKSPLVAVTAQGGQERMHHESHQLLDVVDVFDPVTKWNTGIRNPDTIAEAVRKAFKVAEFEKPGATHLELPEDVAAMATDARPIQPRGSSLGDPDDDALDTAVNLLHEAAQPLLLVGNGAVRAGAADAVREFVARTGVPVVSTYMGKGVVSDDSDRSLMTLDSGPDDGATEAVRRADLVMTVGYDVAEHDPATWNPGGDTAVVHVDSEPAEVYEQYVPAVELVCDVGSAMAALADRCLDLAFDADWYAPVRERVVEAVESHSLADGVTVHAVLPVLRDALDADDVLVSDVGSHKMAIAENYPTYEPNTCIISNGLASMGVAVPGAVAADLAVDANVVAATGDGGFLMNAAELETAVRLGCGFTVVVFVDDDYGLISEQQREHTGEAFGTRLGNPDFAAFAESFGVDAYRAGTESEIRDALDAAVGSDDLALVAVRLDAATT
jgi:acetolactate synthase-1/2/3 large subunit